jgi:hypothetical protein
MIDRSLKIHSIFKLDYSISEGLKKQSRLITLERLADEGCFRNNRQFVVNFFRSFTVRLFRIICSMNNLEKLHLFECSLTHAAIKDLAHVFRSCPKLTELNLGLVKSSTKLEMNEELKNELRPGFERLRLLELDSFFNSGPAIQEMLT